MNTTYYFVAVLFVLSALLTAFVAIRSHSPLRFIAPASVLLSVIVGYFGFDHFLGTPKPVSGLMYWQKPAYGDCGATVLGAEMGKDTVWLMLDEETATTPRLYGFKSSPELLRGLKGAMVEHQKKTGQQFGFSVGAEDPDSCSTGQGQGTSDDVDTKRSKHGHNAGGIQPGSDTDSPAFAEPVSRPPPPKS